MSRMSNVGLIPKTFRKQVTTAGTPVQLTAGMKLPDGISLVIKAQHANTGLIHIGGTSAEADKDSTASFRMPKDTAICIQVVNGSSVWIDADVNGEGVDCIFENYKLGQ